MADKEIIRPIYAELQGYLSQAPRTDKYGTIYDPNLWGQVNDTINELSRVSGEDYSRFKMVPEISGQGEFKSLAEDTYRGKLGGLISRLHGDYFPDEPPPFRGMPSTVISQVQQQNQSFQVELLLQIQSKIDEQIQKLEPGDKKRGFLEKVKGALKTVGNTTELIALLLKTGHEFGLTLEQLSELFK